MTRTTDALELLGGDDVEEIPLDPTPLVRVLAQARFPQMGALLLDDKAVEPLLRAMINNGYPTYDSGFEKEFIIGPNGLSQNESANSKIWQFGTNDGSWKATVTASSLALETTSYESRPDFVQRFASLIETFVETVGQPVLNRLGVRYTNYFESEHEDDAELAFFFDPDMRGPLNVAAKLSGMRHGLSDVIVHDGSRGIQGRWGIVPGGALIDPTVPPTSKRTALLDIDSYSEASIPLTRDASANLTDSLARAAYRLFRTVVADDFIKLVRVDRA